MSCSSSGFNDVSIDMSLLPSKVVFPVMAPANVTARAVLSLSAESALSTYPVLAPASLSVLEGTYDKEKFVATLKGKGIDTVLRYTEEGRIYGTTFIDHRTGCVLNGSRMGKELSANALQEHFTLPYAGQPPISLSVPVEEPENRQGYSGGEYENHSGGMNLFTPEGPAVDAEEEAFIRAMQRKKKKKKRKGLGM